MLNGAGSARRKGRLDLRLRGVRHDPGFPDQFKSHILPDKIHILNVAFLVPEMRREYGGCAANIAYGLTLLGDRGAAHGNRGP